MNMSKSSSPAGTPLNVMRSVSSLGGGSSLASPKNQSQSLQSPVAGTISGMSNGMSRSMSDSFGSSPFLKAQPLVHADVFKRHIVKRSVGGGPLRTLYDGRMSFVSFERGVEWEKPGAKATIPKAKLPPIGQVMEMAQREFPGLERAGRELRAAKSLAAASTSSVQSGSRKLAPAEPYRSGPRLNAKRKPPKAPPVEQEPAEVAAETAAVESAAEGAPVSVEGGTPAPNASEARPEAAGKADGAPEESAEAHAQHRREAAADEDDIINFPWSEEELKMVFNKFDLDRDGEMHKEELFSAIQYLGARPDKKAIKEIADAQTAYNTLGWEEFVEFVSKYREQEVATTRELFLRADADKSGYLDVEEVHSIIRELGFKVTKQVVVEAFEALDDDNGGTLSLREFEGLREHLRQTEGLLKEEVEELKTLYDRAFDKPASPELVAEQSWRISTYVGFSASQEEVQNLCATVDVDASGTVSFTELLKIIRSVGDRENLNLTSLMKKYGEDSNHLKVANLGIALNDLGYFVSTEAVYDVLDAMGETETLDSVTFEELCTFMRIYRKNEGFTEAESKELKEVFDREDAAAEDGPSASCGTLEISRALRYFGFSKTVQEVQALVEEVDFDGSGKLEYNEYVKLMRRFYQGESLKRYRVFEREDVNRKGEVHKDRFADMIYVLQGSEADQELLAKAIETTVDSLPPEAKAHLPAGFVDWSIFESFYKEYRSTALMQVRSNGGYSPTEVAQLRNVFDAYDKDKSGSIEIKELHKLLIEYFPEATESKEGQREIQKVLSEIDGDGNLELEFKEFLWLMRKCDDMRDASDMRLEVEVVQECGLTQEEVDGYRHIFTAHVDWTGEMKLESLADLLTKVVELDGEKYEELSALVRKCHPQRKEVARFPHFLRVVKTIAEENALGANEAATRVVRQEEKARRKK